jgi:hypothetical protein
MGESFAGNMSPSENGMRSMPSEQDSNKTKQTD